MWYTTRQEGFDDPRHSKRGPCLNFNDLITGFLRTGFTLQLGSLTLLYLVYWGFGGSGVFSYDLSGMSNDGRQDQTFRSSLAFLSGLYLLGSLYIGLFQGVMADDACWARGYRAGSKILRLAAFFDIASSTMQFIFYLYVAKFYTPKWFVHFKEGGSEWVFFSYVRLMHAVALLLYASATYLLEVYHDEGAGDLHAYINAALFSIAGVAEFTVIFSHSGGLATALIWITLLAVTTWTYFFEPEVNDASPALYETELTNDVEQQVEKFARMSPYHPSEGSAMSSAHNQPGLGQQSYREAS